MKHMVLLLVLVFTACKKEDPDQRITLSATCRECAVEFRNKGALKRDTVLWELQYTWVDGEAIVDTLPNTARWNIVLPDGEAVYFRACKLSDHSSTITLNTTGDVVRSATSETDCATIRTP